jgi:DNA-directed RNA polymerase specialized sigma24 family protein
VGEDEFTALYNEMSGRLFSFAARRLSPHAAEDTVGQTFETVWLKRGECPGDPDARIGWVFTICRYKVLQEVERRRRKHHDNRYLSDYGPHLGAVQDISDLVVESAVGHWIYGQLSAVDRELFDVATMSDLTPEQAAGMISVSVGTYYTRVSRLRSRLRALRDQAEAIESRAGGVGR